MSFLLQIPTTASDDPLSINVDDGQFVFILGPNGSGKSGLMQHLYGQHANECRRISAHRQTWFHSEDVNITPQQRRDLAQSLASTDLSPTARWKDDNPRQRVQTAIFDLIRSENVRSRAIAQAYEAGDEAEAERLSRVLAPLVILNRLLKSSNLPIEVSISDEEQVLASKRGGAPYSVAKLSDGERNALLIAANVLTVVPGTLILLDEPERHLHRSIISPLLSAMFAERADCAFVISTHDISLCIDHNEAQILLLRDCQFEGERATKWDVDLVPTPADIDDDLKQDILGSRRTILYVEGTSSSLDQPLYSLLFPGVSVVPRDSSRDVERAVEGVRTSESLHWIRAYGLVDGDGRSLTERQDLRTKHVFAVDTYSVESIYYHPLVQEAVVRRHSAVVGGDAHDKLRDAKEAALRALPASASHLCLRLVERAVREQVMGMFPKKEQIAAGATINLTVDCRAVLGRERARFDSAHAAGDLPALTNRYPLRESPAFAQIAEKFGFRDRSQYEEAVRKALVSDPELLERVRSLFGDLISELP